MKYDAQFTSQLSRMVLVKNNVMTGGRINEQ
jgi:hypothetical protein